jgi:hypothetical protein
MERLNSRERMLNALENAGACYVPCNIMLLRPDLQRKWGGQFGAIEKQLDLGLDPKIEIPELPFRFHPDVTVKVLKEKTESGPVLHQEFDTPGGKIKRIVNQTEDWPYSDSVPFLDDWLTPRCRKFLVEEEQDLEAFKYLLLEPTREDIIAFREQAKEYKRFGAERGLLISGGWTRYITNKGLLNSVAGTMGADILFWICGVEQAIMMAIDAPKTLEELLKIVAIWNRKRMEIYLDEEIDLMVWRGYYESTDVWSPTIYRDFMLPILKEGVEITHQAGAKFAYIMTSGILPLVNYLLEAEIDALIGIDPAQGRGNDVLLLKQTLGNKICLWGGVNRALTIEMGVEEDVRKEVEKSFSILAPGGGFILSPIDGVGDIGPPVWDNLLTMIDSWKKMNEEIGAKIKC